MIIGSLTQTKRFEILHPDFKKVFEYVRSGDWQQVTAGKIVLEEDKIWVNVDEVTGKSREAAKLEAHNRFIDIQIPLLQEETFGWEERGRLAMDCPQNQNPGNIDIGREPGTVVGRGWNHRAGPCTHLVRGTK